MLQDAPKPQPPHGNQVVTPLPPRTHGRGLRVNLGSGRRPQSGFVNVDAVRAADPDVVHDLEVFPWPFPDDSVIEVRMCHVLGHVGRDPSVFLRVFQELYRICREGATIDIEVTHPRHDAFLADPTQVRAVTLDTLRMFSKRENLLGALVPTRPLALELDVDFELVAHELVPCEPFRTRLERGLIDPSALHDAAQSQCNVIRTIRATLQVCKDPPRELARRCLAAGDAPGCVVVVRQALRTHPHDPELWHLLGIGLQHVGALAEGDEALERCLALDPNAADAWADRAVLLGQRGDVDGAMAAVDEALLLQPDHALARRHRATLLARAGQYEPAVQASAALVADRPHDADLRTAHGTILRQARRLDEALPHLQLAAQIAPRRPHVQWNLAAALFQAGRHAEGFQVAHTGRAVIPRATGQRMWDGQPAPDRTLLLDAGSHGADALQLVRFAHDAARGGTHVVIRAPTSLGPLLSTAPGVSAVVGPEAEVAADVNAALASVPALLELGTPELRREGPYLAVDPGRASVVVDRLPRGTRIGVVWRGDPDHPADAHRAFPLARLAPLAAGPGVQLVSLQRGPGTEQLDAVGFEVHRPDVDLEADDTLLDIAALMAGLDLVIACDSILGHLAGALDRPCWLALPYAASWRWEPGSPTTPWYRRHRLFQQPSPGSWGPVFDAMARALHDAGPAGN